MVDHTSLIDKFPLSDDPEDEFDQSVDDKAENSKSENQGKDAENRVL